ncbi:MAG: alkaline phosphatase family protein, partial [Actinomycetota bacterium]
DPPVDPTLPTLPAVGHIFTIVVGGAGYNATFAADSSAKYLTKTLAKKGQTLRQYYAVAHEGLANNIAMVSGQPPTVETAADCPNFTDIKPGRVVGQQVVKGSGCVYSANVLSLADQLATIAYRWKVYAQDVEKATVVVPAPEAGATSAASLPGSSTCRHPDIGASDPTGSERPGNGFATSNVGFLYFHSVIDSPDCPTSIVALDDLSKDLLSEKRTPDYSLIVPNLCDGGWAKPCLDGRPGGLVQADAFLAKWVPKILASPAFKRDGLLIVTFDQAPSGKDDGDSRSCCSKRLPGPNVKSPGGTVTPGPGGGRVGAIVVSPFIKPGTTNDKPYDHYSLLATVEDLFGLGRLGYAGLDDVKAFGADVFAKSK